MTPGSTSLDHQRTFIDKDTMLPVHQGYPDDTYDTWPVRGYKTYTSVLTMESLKAAIAIGKELGKSDAELQPYYDWLKTGKQSIKTYLWNANGMHFNISAEVERDAQGRIIKVLPRTDIMADALVGNLYSKLYGLEKDHPNDPDHWMNPVVRSYQLEDHLRKVYDNNFLRFHNGTLGVVNGMTEDGKPLASVGGDVQAGEVWVGPGSAIAALMLFADMKKEAEELVKTDYKNTWAGGFQNNSPEALSKEKEEKGGEVRYRFGVYMRTGAKWLYYQAAEKISELNLSTPARRLDRPLLYAAAALATIAVGLSSMLHVPHKQQSIYDLHLRTGV